MAFKVFLLVCTFGTVSAASFSQARIDLVTESKQMVEVLDVLREKTGCQFVYRQEVLSGVRIEPVSMKDATLTEVLDVVLKRNGFDYEVVDEVVIIRKAGLTQQPQQKTVTGRVTDENNQPVIGVTVVLQNTSIGVATDADGRYSIRIPEGGILVFSHISYNSQMAEVGSRTMVNVIMAPKEQAIDNVIVTGYRLIEEESTTGSYATVGEDILDKKPVTNISHALTGMVAGLATVSSSLDGQNRFLVRGEGTMGGAWFEHDDRIDTDPLIVVDGFPIQGFTPSVVGGNGMLNAKDPFSSINPNDVESITVLKDAAATSIYGARAANGVIVITTKKGKAGEKVNISVNGFVSVSSKPDLDYAFNMASAETQFRYIENMRQFSPDYSNTNPYRNPSNPFVFMSDAASLVYEYFDAGNISETDYNNRKAALIAQGQQGKWKDDLNRLVYRNSVTQQYNVALRGGTNIHTYSFSAGYENEDTYQKGSESQKIMLNIMNNFKLHKRVSLDVGLNASMTKGKNNNVNLGTLRNSISPWTRLVDENGNYHHVTSSITYPNVEDYFYNGWFPDLAMNTMYLPILESQYADKVPSSWYYNPVEDARTINRTSERFNARLNLGLTYNIIDGLSIAVRGQYERDQYETNEVYNPESYFVRHYNNVHSTLNTATGLYETYYPAGGILKKKGDKYEGYTFRAQVDYKKEFSGRHRISAIAGTEVISSSNELNPILWRYGYNKNTNAILSSVDYVNQYTNIFGAKGYMPFISPGTLTTLEDRFFSVYADAEYTYNNRYTATASFRADASNYQAKNVRDKFSPFWSVGAAWIISRENFMNETRWVDYLKLRMSIGESGFAAGKYGQSAVTTVSTSPGSLYHSNNEPFNSVSALGNTTLTWEKSRTFDAAVDFRLWGGKLYGSIEYYNKYSYDVLSAATVPLITQGQSRATFNNAAISNKGVELSLGTRMTIAGDLKWNGTMNFAYNKNEVRKYLIDNTSIRPQTYVGYPKNTIWVHRIAGYTDEGYMILQGKDGTQEIVKDRATTHIYDNVNGAGGEKVEDYNWSYKLGNSTPSTYASFSSTFTWKGLTLSFMLTGKFDYYFSRNDMFSIYHTSASFSKSLEDAFRVYDEGYANQRSYSQFPLYNEANADVFAAGATWMYMSNLNGYAESYYLKGDHIRLNEVYLGYDLPDTILGRQKVFSNINVFFQAKNLGVIWSANKIMDPDYQLGNFKPMSTFTFGLKFSLN